MDDSGLARSRPDFAIRFSRPVGSIELLETIQLHGYHAMLAAGKALDPGDISADWLEQVYEPTVAAIRNEWLDRLHPEATEAGALCASGNGDASSCPMLAAATPATLLQVERLPSSWRAPRPAVRDGAMSFRPLRRQRQKIEVTGLGRGDEHMTVVAKGMGS